MMASTSLKLTSFGTTILVAIVALSCKDLIPWVSSTHLIRFSQFSEWAWPVLVEASAYNIQQQQWSIGALQWANRTGSRKNQINPREMCEGSGSSYSHCSPLTCLAPAGSPKGEVRLKPRRTKRTRLVVLPFCLHSLQLSIEPAISHRCGLPELCAGRRDAGNQLWW